MPRLRYSDEARQDLMRFASFYQEKGLSNIATEAINAILDNSQTLTLTPLIGRPYPLTGYFFRELVINFGNAGYLVLYAFNEQTDVIDILAIRHQRELKYTTF